MRIYLDNCCFNRPFDDQGQIRVRLETEAKLFIQQEVLDKRLDLAWSYILDFENAFNPFPERRTVVARWRHYATVRVVESSAVLERARDIQAYGVRAKDALHIACSVEAECSYFMTTDDDVLKKLSDYAIVKIMNPLKYITEALGEVLS